jgi:PASTA domain
MARLFACIAALAVAAMAAPNAVAVPLDEGGTTFPAIADSAGPEDYSWEVTLFDGQDLKSVDDQHAAVYYEDGEHVAFTIAAVKAHDADGTDVRTSLAVSEPNILILTVHHRAGNPAAGGAPFDYPVIAGEGWEGGFKTEVVLGPKDEQELREERERKAREEREAAEREPVPVCLVSNVKGRTLKGAKLRLRKASCRIGKVRKRKGVTARTGEVIRQGPRPGLLLPVGTAVNVTLGD